MLLRLYETDAAAIVDDELADEVGWALYARCDAIVSVTNGYEKKQLRCPRCGCDIPLSNARFECPCGFIVTWEEFRRSYKINNSMELMLCRSLCVF